MASRRSSSRALNPQTPVPKQQAGPAVSPFSPLPPTATKTSTAYGGKGKASRASKLGSEMEGGDYDSQLASVRRQSTRAATVSARQASEQRERESSQRAAAKTPRRATARSESGAISAAQEHLGHSQLEPVPESEEAGPSAHAEQHEPSTIIASFSHEGRVDGSPSTEDDDVEERLTWLESFWTVKTVLHFLLGMLTFVSILLLVQLFSTPSDVTSPMAWHKRPTANAHRAWLAFTNTGTETFVLTNLDQRVSTLNTTLTKLIDDDKIMDASFQELLKILPDPVVAQRNEDGVVELPEQLWQAIKEKVNVEFGKLEKGRTWEAFVKHNRAKLDALMTEKMDGIARHTIQNQNILTHQALLEAVNEKQAALRAEMVEINEAVIKQYKQSFSESQSKARTEAQDFVRDTFNRQMQNLPYYQLEQLATANLLANMRHSLTHANFFSYNLGAVIDPRLTSSTQPPKPANVLKGAYEVLVGPRFFGNPASTALQAWNEAGDCWCASSPKVSEIDDIGAKAQIAITSPKWVFPRSITVEHVPKSATFDISSAPQELELWVEVLDPNVRAELQVHFKYYTSRGERRDYERRMVALEAIYGFKWWNPRTWSMQKLDYSELEYQREYLGRPLELDLNYIRVASWMYDVHAHNHIQTFDLGRIFLEHGVPIKKTVVRATSNWGKDYTCIYRLRLHGYKAEEAEDKEYEGDHFKHADFSGWPTDGTL